MLSESEKSRLVRGVMGDREMRARDIVTAVERMGFAMGRQVNNWLVDWAKAGAVVTKVRRGVYAPGPTPVPRAQAERPVELPAPRPAPLPPAEDEETQPLRAGPVDLDEDDQVDDDAVLRTIMVWFRTIVEGGRCEDCGSVTVTGPVLNAVKRYQDAALKLNSLQQGRRAKMSDAELHRLRRENELLKRDLQDAERRVRELEAPHCGHTVGHRTMRWSSTLGTDLGSLHSMMASRPRNDLAVGVGELCAAEPDMAPSTPGRRCRYFQECP